MVQTFFGRQRLFAVQHYGLIPTCCKFFFKFISWYFFSGLFLKFSAVLADFLSSMKLHSTKLVGIATCSGHSLSWLKISSWELFWPWFICKYLAVFSCLVCCHPYIFSKLFLCMKICQLLCLCWFWVKIIHNRKCCGFYHLHF